MRRITSFFALLVLLMMSIPASAQNGYLDELKAKKFNLGQKVEEIVPDTWYLVYQCRGGGGYLFDSGVGAQVLKGPLDDILAEDNIASDKAKYLVRFVEGESTNVDCPYSTYYLQFGTGHWIGDGEDYPVIAEDQDEACCWNVGQMSDTNKGHFWFTLDYLKGRIDNNDFSGDNATVVYWETGPTVSIDGNCDWSVYSIDLIQGDEVEILFEQVTQRYNTLLADYDAFEPGTGAGQYDAAKVQAFRDILDEVGRNLEDENYVKTVEGLQDLLDRMNEAYEAVKKAQNRVPDGYYFLRSAAPFYTKEMVEEEEVTTYLKKAIYDNASGTGWTTFTPETADLSFLFRVDYDESTGYYEFSNVATGRRMPQIWAGWDFSLEDATAAESEVELGYFGKSDDGYAEYTVRRADQINDSWADWEFAYIQSYSSGAGVTGTLCAWSPTSEGRGAWAFLPVDDAKVEQLFEDYKAIREHDAFVARYDSLKTLAIEEMAIAKEMSNLVTEASQFTSPWTEPYEGTIEALIDNDYSSYWHSCWSSGTADMDVHYLQVALPDPLDGGIKMTFVRRSTSNNQVTDLILKASNTPSDAESWTELGHFLFDDTSQGVLFTSDPIMFEGSYQYFRIYPHITVGESESMAGYWHAAEINFLPAVENPNCQANKMGNLYTDLEAVLAEQADVTGDNLTTAIYNKLQNAIDAFHTMYVDPRPLRSAITAAKKSIANVVEGTDPGCWSDTSTKTSLQTVVDNAATYNTSGDYTATQSETYVKQLTEGNASLMDAANKVQTNKWYQIQFPSEEMYDTYEWSKSGASQDVWGNLVYADALFDKVVTLGALEAGDGVNTSSDDKFAVAIDADEAYQGTLLVADDADDIDEDLALFRFVSVGDSAYAIQNKATGLFIKLTGTSANTVADMQPTLFKVNAIGTGANVLKAEGIDGTDYAYMHLQLYGSNIVSWDASALGSNSAFLIKEKDDITTLPKYECTKEIEPGKLYPMCYAASFKITEGDAELYTVRGINDNAGTYSVVLTPTDEATAGETVVLVAGGEYSEPAKGEDPLYNYITLQFGSEYVTEPLTATCVRGTYNNVSAAAGTLIANGDTFDALAKTTTIACNAAYFVYEGGSVDAQEGDLVIPVGGKGTVVDSIENIVNKIATTGAVYSIDGRQLLEKGNINSLRQYGKGMYIVNGVKVLVK